MIIDAHAHVFRRIHGRVAAGATRGSRFGQVLVGREKLQLLPPFGKRTVFTLEMLVAHMDWAGVDKAVLLQGPFYGECNRYVAEAIHRHPDRLAGAACLDPWDKDCRRVFETEVSGEGFAAIKLECSEATGLCGLHPGARLGDPALLWLWGQLERLGVVLVLDLGAVGCSSYQTFDVRTIAAKHLGLKIVIAHLAQPTPAAEADPDLWRLWEQQIDLGRLPNVWFDTASLPAYLSAEGFPYPTVARYLRCAADRIGPEKLMWGTDIPGLLAHVTYKQLVALGRLHTGFLSADQQQRVLGGNALNVFF